MKMISPIPWVGSKRQLRDTIVPLIPPHTCYVEVFTGAGWVYLGKEPSKVEVINDINGDLIRLFAALKNQTDEFLDALWYMFPSRDMFMDARGQLESLKVLTDMERAVLFYYHIKNAFGGKYGGGFGFARTQPPRRIIAADLAIKLRDRLMNTYVENLSFERLIKNYDAPETFFYLDPPYIMDSGDRCYQFEFKLEDHIKLSKILINLMGKFLLSYVDHPWVRETYKDFKIETTPPVTYTLSGKAKQKTELFISNY
jgi:DNA adenine methylase